MATNDSEIAAAIEAQRQEEDALERERNRKGEKESSENENNEEAQGQGQGKSTVAVYEDKPLSPRRWVSDTIQETENEVTLLTSKPVRDKITVEVSRLKSSLYQRCVLHNRDADVGGVQEFRAHKDPHFVGIREGEIGIQAAPFCVDDEAQTTWYRAVNKAIQYESLSPVGEPSDNEGKENLLAFLESATMKIENSLQQNETLDIFRETFHIKGDEELQDDSQTESELRELKNFADPTYSKSKVLSAIDWMPKSQGMVAVSVVKNLSFDERVLIAGHTSVSYLLLWDFRQLVRPQVLMQCPHEIFTFRFNATNPNLIAGGSLSGQVFLWDLSESLSTAAKRGARGSKGQQQGDNDDEEGSDPVCLPKLSSNVDYGHKKCVADLFWLPPNVQINYRGQLVGNEHLDDKSYQFITVAGDGQVMVWDIRYEQIANDELRHIGRAKHVPMEKAGGKDGGTLKPQWTPIFKAHLKRMEGVGELSLCRAAFNTTSATSIDIGKDKPIFQDVRSHIMLATEEGDILSADLSGKKAETNNNKDDDEDEASDSKEFLRWMAPDHCRPCVSLQQSPFFPNILLSVGDWKFHIWKIGEDKPLFVSPHSNSYLTAGAWSPTRPAVLMVASADGSLFVWDFTDSSYRPSIELKATHTKITAMEFLPSSHSRQQLLAVGDESGTLHIFEVARTITRPINREEAIMSTFLERESKRIRNLLDESGELSHNKDQAKSEVDIPNPAGRRIDKETEGESKRETKEDLQREDDDFLKLESIFVTELGLEPISQELFKKISEETNTKTVPSRNRN